MRDAAFALRLLRRQPGFALAALVTFGLGIGVTTAVFSLVQAVVLRPLPFKGADRLVQIDSIRSGERGKVSMRDLDDLRERVSTLQEIASYLPGSQYSLSGHAGPEKTVAVLASHNLFRVLGVPLLYGEPFPPSFDRERHNGIMLGYGLWQRQFGGDRDIVGRSVTLDASPALNVSYTVFGVLPPNVDFPRRVDLYRSMFINGSFPDLLRRDRRTVIGIARMRPSASVATVEAELRTISQQLAREFPDTNEQLTFAVTPLAEVFSGPLRPYIWLLLAAVGTVLLIAVANVANLLLSRSLSRAQELSVRRALGASRVRVVRQLVTEGVVLAFLGGILGMALAHAFLRALTQLVKLDLPVWMDATIEPRVVAFAMIASAIAGLAASAAPALRITRSEHDEALRLAGGRTIGASRHSRLRRALMASELAVSVLLFVLSGLMVQTFVALWQTDLGFRARGLLTFKLALPVYYDEEATRQFQRQLLARLHALPAVTAATCNANLPLARVGQAERETLVLDGQSVADAAGNPYINFQRVCDRYFEVMQIPILRGRALGTTDRSGAVLAAVVSRRAADRLWPGRDPIGQRFRKVGPDAPWIHIVGIADDVRHAAIAAAPAFDIYLSAEQMTDGWMHFAVRTDSAPMSLVNDVRRAVHAINAEQPVGEFQPMEERAMDTAWQQRVAAFLLGVFSVMALVLAAIGIYGVTAYTVGQRTQEFGLRRALGAGSRDLVSTVLRETVGVAALGTVSGLVAAAASVRVMKALLYETSPLDPVTFVAAPLTLMLVAILAATVPAVRAARIDPMSALRQ